MSMAPGLTVLGIGLIGLLKAAVEMFEHHQIDKTRLKLPIEPILHL